LLVADGEADEFGGDGGVFSLDAAGADGATSAAELAAKLMSRISANGS
jgi:hypothetical protein